MACTKPRARLTVLCIAAAFGMMAGTAPAGAQISSDDDDVLDGQQYLVRADDLVVADPYPLSSTNTQVQYFSLDTDDMVISTSDSVQATAIVNAACVASSPVNTPFPAQTQPMRMFNLPYDVVVTLAPSVTASGSGCSSGAANGMEFYVKDPTTGDTYITSVGNAGITNHWLQTAVADFDGDGFDDLFFSSDTWTYVATANDTDSPSSGITIRSSLKTGSSLTPMADPTVGDFNADGNLDVAWMGTDFSSGSEPIVHFATVCTGPIDGTVCANANTFDIILSGATITPSAPTGAIVTVGGDCTKTDSNQSGSELRAPPMAVAAGQFDDSAGDELVVAVLYEDKDKECKVVAESYSFTAFDGSGSAGEQIVPKQEDVLDNLGPHGHISNPAAIYAVAGQLDWSSNMDKVAVAISGSTDHNIMIVSLDNNLMMTSRDAPFNSGNDNKSFAGLTIGRFSAAPAADTSKSCTDDSTCTDTCKNSACEISGNYCTSDGDCAGTCTSDGVCSYIQPNSYNLQVAGFLMARNSDHNSLVYIYTANPPSAPVPAEIQSFDLKNFEQPSMNIGYRGGSLLRAGDLQGRSQRLGTPTVVRVSDTNQPDVVLFAPPTHADWLPFNSLPNYEMLYCDSSSCPGNFSSFNVCSCDASNPAASDTACEDGTPLNCLVNFSVLPGNYFSQYAFSETSSNQSSSTDTTAWSLGLSVDLKEKTKSLTPTGLEFTQEVQFASQNTYNHSVANTHNKYSSTGFNAATKTGFDDYVWFSTRDYNIYLYPVIGQTICVDSCQESGTCSISTSVACTDDSDCPEATSATDCPDDAMQQLYVQYSGASSVSVDFSSSSTLEWYQPVHEPGQIFSYAPDCDELASRYGVNICDASGDDYTLLAETATFNTVTDAHSMLSMNWMVGSGSSRMTIKGGQWSQSLSETMSLGTSSLESQVEGFKVSEKTTINASESYTTAKTNTTTLGSSTGVTIMTEGTFLDETAYSVTGFVFGDAPKPGTLQQLTPTDDEDDVLANGVIHTAFTAAPSDSWWTASNPYDSIDVALNRPLHLYTQSEQGHSEPSVTQCLPISDESAVTDSCVNYEAADPRPTEVWTNGFYSLRGFFITPADAVGQGPQLQVANEGDQLALQVRVYNYSLTDMPASAEIGVDFYVQEWDNDCNAPAGYYQHDSCMSGNTAVDCTGKAACGPTATCCISNMPVDSIRVGHDTLDPLPAFNSAAHSGDPNWQFATTTFDTGDPTMCGDGGCGDKYFVFWVVAWPQDTSTGALYQELPDHSLTKVPGLLSSIRDLCPINNSCLSGTCKATGETCSSDADCPTKAQNTCGSNGTCGVSGATCTSDADCGDCLCATGCVDEFSNNVGMYKQSIYVLPESTEIDAPEGELTVESVTVSPGAVQIGQKAVVTAALRAVGGRINGQMIRFHAVPPESSDLTIDEVFDQIPAFDMEIVPYIRAEGTASVQVGFRPPELGDYEILVSTVRDGARELLGAADLEVTETLPTATPTVPPAPPSVFDEDDSCAISSPGRPSTKGALVLLLAPMILVALRARSNRSRGRRNNRRR